MNQEKNKSLLLYVVFLIVGLFVGWLVWGMSSQSVMVHRMPDGSLMKNDGSAMDMSSMMHDMMASLQGKTGNEFDQAFLSEMIIHHEGAVVMAEAVLTSSERPELIQLAKDIITAQTKEIEMMKMWQRAWK